MYHLKRWIAPIGRIRIDLFTFDTRYILNKLVFVEFA